MARYPPAVWHGTDKHGYGGDDSHLGQGICAHSMEGSLAAAFGRLDNPDEDASWHFSVAKDGSVYQHVDTSNIAWANGSYDANRRFWCIEHEGVAGEPLTPQQLTETTVLMAWLLEQGGLMPVRQQTLWEHNEMTAFGASPTACPSGRIPWAEIIPALEEHMALVTQEDIDRWNNTDIAIKAVLSQFADTDNAIKQVLWQLNARIATLEAKPADNALITDLETRIEKAGQALKG